MRDGGFCTSGWTGVPAEEDEDDWASDEED
jgi:hypothetical protein